MRDFSKDLIMVSRHLLPIEEAERRLLRDINNGLCLFELNGDPEHLDRFDPTEHQLRDFMKRESSHVPCLQIDLLRPQYDYVSMLEVDLVLAISTFETVVEDMVRECVESHSDLRWHTLSCTTQDDSIVSAFRRSTFILEELSDGTLFYNHPSIYRDDVGEVLEQHDALNEAFDAHIPTNDFGDRPPMDVSTFEMLRANPEFMSMLLDRRRLFRSGR